MPLTTKNDLGATRTESTRGVTAGEAEREMVSPSAFPRRRHLEIAYWDVAHAPFLQRSQHHPRQRFAGSLLAMRSAPGRTDNLAFGLQPLLRPGVGAGPAMVRLPALVEMFDGPPRVASLIEGHHLHDLIHWDCTG